MTSAAWQRGMYTNVRGEEAKALYKLSGDRCLPSRLAETPAAHKNTRCAIEFQCPVGAGYWMVKEVPQSGPARILVCACKQTSPGYNRGMNDVEQVLRRAIDKSSLDAAELARRAGLTKGSLSLFINHKRGLTLRSVNKLAAALGLELVEKRGR